MDVYEHNDATTGEGDIVSVVRVSSKDWVNVSWVFLLGAGRGRVQRVRSAGEMDSIFDDPQLTEQALQLSMPKAATKTAVKAMD